MSVPLSKFIEVTFGVICYGVSQTWKLNEKWRLCDIGALNVVVLFLVYTLLKDSFLIWCRRKLLPGFNVVYIFPSCFGRHLERGPGLRVTGCRFTNPSSSLSPHITGLLMRPRYLRSLHTPSSYGTKPVRCAPFYKCRGTTKAEKTRSYWISLQLYVIPTALDLSLKIMIVWWLLWYFLQFDYS